MKTKIKAILFDIDDTLYDREKNQPMVLDKIIERLPHIFGNLGKKQILEAFLESDRISTRDWEGGLHHDDIRDYRSKIFLKALNLPLYHADTITKVYLQEYPFINAPVDGAVKLVKKTSRLFKIGVISNSLPDVQYQKIDTLGLGGYFSCVVLAMEVGLKKPDPRIFLYAAEKLEVKPGECLYIGDNFVNDVIGAKEAGMVSCWFRRNKDKVDNPMQAHFIVESLEEAGRIIDSL
jgi:HAD superfamily hydrolase (TIGR01549 family)